MKRHIACSMLLLAGLFATQLFGQQRIPPPAKAFATAPEIPYDSVPNFLKLPTGMYLGEGIGVARNSKGDVFVYTRGGEASRLYEFDPKGAFVREIGKGLYGFQMAHAVRVDPQDNIWVVDEGTDMVIKFTPDGRVAMTMGRRAEFGGGLRATPPPNTPPPPPQPYRFGRPTDVAWDAAGNIFISDGYTNSRVVKYDKNGRFIKSIGTKGTGPAPVQYSSFHSDGRERQRLRRGSRKTAHSGLEQRPRGEGGLRQRGRALGALHHSRAASIPLQLEFQPGQQQFALQCCERRNLQDGVGWDGAR